jgi:hypothetical protein
MTNSNTAVAQPTLIVGEGAVVGKRVFSVRSSEIDAPLFDPLGAFFRGNVRSWWELT